MNKTLLRTFSHMTVAVVIGVAALVFVIILTALSFEIVDSDETTAETTSPPVTYNDHGYNIGEISRYSRWRASKLLTDNGFTDYEVEIWPIRRNYNYTVEDYSTITELDETYLYGLYTLVADDDFAEFLKVLGYYNLDDFLIKNNYVDRYGEPSTYIWCEANITYVSGIMAEESR